VKISTKAASGRSFYFVEQLFADELLIGLLVRTKPLARTDIKPTKAYFFNKTRHKLDLGEFPNRFEAKNALIKRYKEELLSV